MQYHDDLKIDPNKIIISGSSSGATLAMLTMHRFAKIPSKYKLAGGVFVSPTTDFNNTTPNPDDIFPAGSLEYLFRHFLRDFDDPLSPDISPAMIESAEGLPPVALVVPKHDAIFSHSKSYHEKLRSLSADIDMHVVPGMIHAAFQSRAILDDGADMAKIVANSAKRMISLTHSDSPTLRRRC